MKLRVGILTLHLHVNYGGIIQTAALYRFLVQHGFEPVFLRKAPQRSLPSKIARSILRFLPGQNIRQVRSNEHARATHYPFIKTFLPNASRTVENSRQLAREVNALALDAVIVGSDQVWRLNYHQDANHMAYFLDFMSSPPMAKIAYAASFGVGDWRHPERTAEVSRLIANFDAVSVRETSGEVICRDIFGRLDCQVVLDPTLIVADIFYHEIAGLSVTPAKPYILSYLLDSKELGRAWVEHIGEQLGGGHESRSLSIRSSADGVDIPAWLRAFRDSDYVVTDSYHGMIFAIIFRKQFVVLANHGRGLDRFVTLLEALGLGERLIRDSDPSSVGQTPETRIDFDAVHERLGPLRARSRDFLLAALGGPLPEASVA